MILVYFITIMVIAALLMLIRKRTFQFVAMPAFAIIQVLFTCDIFVRRQISFSDYFRVDALGLIFLTLLAILTVTTIIQSLVYLEKRKDTPEHRAHYLAP